MSFVFGRNVLLGLAPVLLIATLASSNATPQGNESRVADANSKKTPGNTNRYRFVNLNKVLEGWTKAKKTQEEFSAEFDRRAEGLRTRIADIQKKSQELNTLQQAGSTDEARKRARDLKIATEEVKYDQEQLKNDQRERRLRILLSSYQQIQDVVAKWAAKNDVDAVFVIQEEDAADSDLLGKYERALVRQVLWYSKDLDISEEVVKLLEVAAPAPMNSPSVVPAAGTARAAPAGTPSTASKPAGTSGNK